MVFATLFRVIIFCNVLPFSLPVAPLAKKTKLCGDENCTEKLFEGRFQRLMNMNDNRFLTPQMNDIVSIYAIKFSDRIDLMEGALVRNPEQRGNLFSSQITLDGYVNFLKNAVESNKTLFMISTDPRDELPSKKLVGQQSAFPGLVRDYEVNSHKLAVEGVIPRPLPLNFASLDPVALEALRQAHSHGHSHNHAHAHSHGHSHDGMEYAHAFENHQQNQALPPPPPTAQLPPSQTQQIRNNPPPDITTSSQPLSNDAAKVPTQPAPAPQQPQLPKPVAQPQATNSQSEAGVAAALPTTAKTLQAVPSEAGAMPGDTPQMASGQQLPADNSQHAGARPALRNVQQPAGAQRAPQGNPPSSGGQSVSGGVPQPARGQPLPGDNLQPSGGQPVPEGTFQATNVQPITPDSPKTVIEQPVPGAASQPESVPQPVNPEVKPMGAQPLLGSINQRTGGSDQQVPNKVDNQSTGQQGQTITHNANQQTSGQSLPANSHQTIGGANVDGGQSTNGESVQVPVSGNVKNVIDGKEDPQLTASNNAQNVNRDAKISSTGNQPVNAAAIPATEAGADPNLQSANEHIANQPNLNNAIRGTPWEDEDEIERFIREDMERQAMKMQGAASVGLAREATSNTLDSSAPAPYSTLYQPNADDQVPKSMAFDEIPLNSVMRNAELHEMHYQNPSLNANVNAFDEKNQQQHQQNILVVGGGGLASLPQPSMASFSSIPISEIPVLSTTTQSPSVAHHSVPITNQPTQTVSALSPGDASIHSREPIAETQQQPSGSFGGISQEQKQQINPNTVDAEISSFGTAPPSNPSSNNPVDLNAQPLPSTLSPTASSFSVPSLPSPIPPPLPRDASDQLPQASPTATVSPYPINIDPTPTIKINPQQPSGNLPVNDNTAGSLSATDAAMLRRYSDVPNDVGHMASISTDHLWPSSDEVNRSQEPLQGKSGDGEKQSESHGEALPNQLGATPRKHSEDGENRKDKNDTAKKEAKSHNETSVTDKTVPLDAEKPSSSSSNHTGGSLPRKNAEEEEVGTKIFYENGLGYCVKGDCDRLGADTSADQPSDSVEKTPSNVVVPTASVPAHEDQQPPPVFEPPTDTRPAESHETIDDQSHGEQAPAQPPPPVPEDPSMSGAIPMDPSLNPADYHSTAENTTRSGVGKWLSKMISLFRYALPAAMADIDDAGVVVTLLVPVFLIIHLVRILLPSDNTEQEVFDRRTLHDALTAVRERDEQIKLLRVEAEKGRGMMSKEKDEQIERLKTDLGRAQLNTQQLKIRCDQLEESNERLRKECEDAKKSAESERRNSTVVADENKQLERSNQMLTEQIAEMQSTMESAREKNDKLEDELADRNALITRLETENRSNIIDIKKLTDQLQTAANEGEVLRERIEALQSETVQLSEMIEELNRAKEAAEAVAQQHAVAENVSNSDDHAAHESGGSGGWSDVGDFDIETPAINDEKKNVSPPLTANNVQQQQTAPKGNDNSTLPPQTKSGSTGDIMEVARLRAQLKRLEIDLDQTRLSLQKEENVREHLTRKLELAELEANERKKETEAKESERVDTHNQCKKMLAMVEERDAKIRHSEQLTEKLRDEIDKWQTEVRHLQEQNKVIENKLNDAEQELKRLRAENNRLETRHFHEMRECKHTITTLRQSLEEAQRMAATATAAIPPQLPDSGGNNLMNLSSNGSSDREYPSAHAIGSRLGPPPLPAIRPLWGDDEAAEVFSAGESISSMMSGRGLRHTATSPDNLSSGVPLKKGSVRSRRSQREQPRREVSPEIDLMQHAPRPKKEGRRMRSRSHGRHPFLTNAPSYMMMQPPAFPDLFSDHPPPPTLPFQPSLHKRNSKSGNLYYSSGGSNGGLSPPPEMALLSGVPPPGMSIRKPTATSRPKSVAEQMARHQN